MSNKKDNQKELSWDNYRQGISVYACQSDTTHPKVLQLALQSGLITEERHKELTTKVIGEKPVLDSLELRAILEAYFGFFKGSYEEDECEAIQTTRFGKQVAGEYRYMGEERTDKDWCSTGLASEGAKDVSRYGSVVTLDERDGKLELNVSDVSNDSNY